MKIKKEYINLMGALSELSDDKNSKVGCFIKDKQGNIVSVGYNRFPDNIKNTSDKHERPKKYRYMEHAERVALYNSNKSLKECSMYIPGLPCCDCARAMIFFGIESLWCCKDNPKDWMDRWGDNVNEAIKMLREAGIKIFYYER